MDNRSFSCCCKSKINSTLIDNAEDLYIVILKYNMFEYSDNYSMKSGCLWNYYRKTLAQPDSDDDNNGENIPSLNIEFTILLNYFSTFCRSLDSPLINCGVQLDLLCRKDCVLVQDNNITGANFMITSNLYQHIYHKLICVDLSR